MKEIILISFNLQKCNIDAAWKIIRFLQLAHSFNLVHFNNIPITVSVWTCLCFLRDKEMANGEAK